MDKPQKWVKYDLGDGSRVVLIPVRGSDTFGVQMTVSIGHSYSAGPADF